ncbi:MAG: thioesterase domain-containing protein, partial [Kofleriaceae bacterium]
FEHCSTGQIHRWREAGAAAATYDSLLVYENYPDHAVASDATLRIDALESRTVGARTGFAATLLIGSLAGFWIKLIYQRKRFDDAAVPLILGHLRMLVERIAAEPTVRVGALLDAIADAEIPVVYSQPALLSPEQRRWVGPRDVTELKLAKLWQNILRCDLVGAYDNFFDLGGHSLLALDLMARIEDEFGVRLPMSALLEHPTIEAVARQLRERSAPQPWSALVPIRSSGGRTPLFCVPGAAIDAISLHPLAHALGDDQPFYGIQPRGLDDLLAPHATVEAMAAEVVEAMRSVQPRGPYYIAGHSFGAHIAYEVSQQLGDAGCEVGLLTLLDAEASTLGHGPAAAARTSMDRLGRLLSLVHRFFGHDVALAVDPTLPPDELIEHVAVKLAEAKILPTGLGAKRVKSYLAVGEATSLAFDAYRPACRHPVDTLLVRAREVHRDDHLLGGAHPDDEALGWRRLTGRDVTVSWLSGDHVTIMTRPNVQTMADLLLEAMRQPHALPRRRPPAPEVSDGAR